MSRLRVVFLVVVVLALVSGCTFSDSRSAADSLSHPVRPVRHESPPTTPTADLAGTNRTIALAAASRAFKDFPIPPDATRTDAAPPHERRLQRLGAFIGPVDRSLTRTGWWLVPLRYDQLVNWYVAHTPADPRTTYVPGSHKPAPKAEVYWSTHNRATAYSPPAEVVSYARLGPHTTAIRTDVTLAARADRTTQTLVPADVTILTITKQAIDGPDHSPTTVTVTNQGRIFDVIAAFDHAKGEYANIEPQGCGSPAGLVYWYRMTLHWPGHTLDVDTGQPLCGIGRTLTLDGTKLPQTVHPGTGLDAALQAAFDTA